MTVRYKQEVATASCGGFLKLLLKWEGSIYKLIWFELCIFLGSYATLSLCYHFAMNEQSKRTFENIAQYCNKYSNLIPISFVLGFYVQRVINRFWEQLSGIPWPHRMAIYVSTYIQCKDERGRLMRRTIMRYICLSFVMTMSSISPQIKKRFPTLTHMTEAGFLMVSEQHILEKMTATNNKYFVPLIWATSVVAKARKEGKIKSDLAVQKLVSEINSFRGGCGGLFNYDWVSIPLGYTQVVTLAVYIFSLCCLLGRYQFEVGNPAEKHFPFFTILQFVFYMGWLKVAECLLSPFGEDDDDFDVNLLVDRYLHESYIIVDEMFMKMPDMLKDQHWDLVDFDLPYTSASVAHKKDIFLGSAAGMEIPANKQAFVPVQTSHGDLRSVTSIKNMAGQPSQKSKKRHKGAPALEEASESKESAVIHGGVVPSVEKPVRVVERLSTATVWEQPVVEQRTSVEQEPRASEEQQPSTSAEQQPSTSAEQQPSTSAEQQPSTSAEQQPSTSAEQQQSTLEQESHLMSLFQDQLKVLRS